MRIIDPHVHVWKNDPKYPWGRDERRAPKEDATPEMLLELMEANGVEKTVLVQVIHYLWDNSYAADAMKRYPWTDTHEQVKKVYHAFGGSRIMWGTDWPVCLSRATYAQTLSVVRDEMDFFTPEDKEWVLGKTALQLWQFPCLD